jgi:hypothetical protein
MIACSGWIPPRRYLPNYLPTAAENFYGFFTNLLPHFYTAVRNLVMSRAILSSVRGDHEMQINTFGRIARLPALSQRDSPHHQSTRVWQGAFLLSGFLGIGSGIAGLIYSFESLSGFVDSRLSIFGTILIAAMFPLLILAAHCLDKIGEANRASRLKYCRQHGLKDQDC